MLYHVYRYMFFFILIMSNAKIKMYQRVSLRSPGLGIFILLFFKSKHSGLEKKLKHAFYN